MSVSQANRNSAPQTQAISASSDEAVKVLLQSGPTARWEYRVLKRAVDVIFSAGVLIVAAPLMLLIGVAVKCSGSGPVLFRQQRVGRSGQLFWIYKFRTLIDSEQAVSDRHWTRPMDKRITPLGRILRQTSLDELPQFYNVLRGDMSLAGPRPERPHFVEAFQRRLPDYWQRHIVLGGITGWAQVNGWRGDTSIEKRLEHDLYYLRHWTPWLDLKILLMTLARGFYHPNAG